MTSQEMGELSRDVEKLMEEYKTHPGIMLFQPQGTRKMFVMFIGNPSIEWISKAGEGFAKKLENLIELHQLRGT
jgi:hypothetical protein